MMLSQIMQAVKQVASASPAASAGLSKAIAGINEAMSAIVVNSPNPQVPSQNPPY